MRSVGIKVLKNKLSEYVRAAAGGETILVTDRERVVAELRPPHADRGALSEGDFFAEAAREGWLTLPAQPSTEPPPRKPMMTFREVMKDLDRLRRDR